MPIVDVEMVVSVDLGVPGRQPDAARDDSRRLADALGEVFGSPPTGTWVRLRFLPATQYAENHDPGDDPPAPVFVTVLKARLASGDELAREAHRVSAAVAAILGRPAENVHVLYEPEGAERIAFGGELRRE